MRGLSSPVDLEWGSTPLFPVAYFLDDDLTIYFSEGRWFFAFHTVPEGEAMEELRKLLEETRAAATRCSALHDGLRAAIETQTLPHYTAESRRRLKDIEAAVHSLNNLIMVIEANIMRAGQPPAQT